MSTVDEQLTGLAPTASSGRPYEGKPFNFSRVLDAVLIPRVVTRNTELPPGARLLWGVIRQHIWTDEGCLASDETLAKEVGVSTRQLKRYSKILIERGFMRSEFRGNRPAARWLLWHSCFSEAALLGSAAGTPPAPRKKRPYHPRKNPAKPVVQEPPPSQL